MGAKPYPAYKDSGIEWIGSIPEHWEVKRIGLFLAEQNGRVGNQTVKLLGLSKTKGVQSRDEFDNRASVATTYENYKLTSPGFIVMSKMQAWNGVFGISFEHGMVSPDYAVYEPKSIVNQYFFVYTAKTDPMAGVFHRYSRGMGTALLRLNSPEFFAIPIPFPPIEEQKLNRILP